MDGEDSDVILEVGKGLDLLELSERSAIWVRETEEERLLCWVL